MKLARRHVKHLTATIAIVNHAIRGSAYVEVTPLPGGWHEIAVKPDRASLLPIPKAGSVIDPDSPSSGEDSGKPAERRGMA